MGDQVSTKDGRKGESPPPSLPAGLVFICGHPPTIDRGLFRRLGSGGATDPKETGLSGAGTRRAGRRGDRLSGEPGRDPFTLIP